MRAPRHSQLLASSILSMAILFLSMSMPIPVHALSVVELSPINGSTVCPTDLVGPGVASTTWNNATSTCSVVAQSGISPTVCIARFAQCAGASIDRLIIDSGVTLVMEKQANARTLSLLCVYSSLENHGTIEGGSICDYGTITNYGTIDISAGQFFELLPFNGQGILNNARGGVLVNNYTLSDLGMVVNNGTIYNRGQFGNDNDPTYSGSFANYGRYIGSAPCFFVQNCHTSFGLYNVTSSGTVVDDTLWTGVNVTITGATGTNVDVLTQNQTNAAPIGPGALNVTSPVFYDVMINGLLQGTARICVTNKYVNQSMAGGMQYWNMTGWASAARQIVSTSSFGANQTSTGSPFLSLCGDVLVMALTGTPIGAGILAPSNRPSSLLFWQGLSTLVNQSVTFHASVIGGTAPYTYSWDFGDGVTGVGNPATHAFHTQGNYTVTLTATDSNAQSIMASQTISVNPVPKPVTGPQGPQGSQGPAGPMGPPGPSGVQGVSPLPSNTTNIALTAIGVSTLAIIVSIVAIVSGRRKHRM